MSQYPIMSISISVYENNIVISTRIGKKALIVEGVEGKYLDKFIKMLSQLTKKDKSEPVIITFGKNEKDNSR